ncbi:hypothetical protein GALL_199340 [mine drainage metagenome]|uniref:Ice-binding protein C-terminal domain-containing protein n=1 Tax=mine drainage metagenome TaxID=410659 RepID=A0A1J5SCR4_9ZZZZ
MNLKCLVLLAVGVVVWLRPYAEGQTVITMGTASSYGALAGVSVTNTGATTINGNLGVSAATTPTGFPPGVLNGTLNVGNAAATQAVADAQAAYNVVQGEAATQILTGSDLGSRVLTPGVYFFATSAQLTGGLTLDAGNTVGARFDFQIGSTLTTAAGSSVSLIHGAAAGNVYWQVGTSATLGTGTVFSGNVLADQSITMNSGSTLSGTAAAINASVTLDSNTITASPGGAGPAVPEPATTALLMAGAVGLFVLATRFRRPGPVQADCS